MAKFTPCNSHSHIRQASVQRLSGTVSIPLCMGNNTGVDRITPHRNYVRIKIYKADMRGLSLAGPNSPEVFFSRLRLNPPTQKVCTRWFDTIPYYSLPLFGPTCQDVARHAKDVHWQANTHDTHHHIHRHLCCRHSIAAIQVGSVL